MPSDSEEDYFDKRWLKPGRQEEQSTTDLRAIREFAYSSFDRLDKDADGFIQRKELVSVLENETLDSREKSFVTFLLNSHEQISSMNDETSDAQGISRNDIELYFTLIANLL